MLRVIPIQRFGIAENSGGFFKRHAVLLEVAQGFSGIPREHITVYTLIEAAWEEISNEKTQRRTAKSQGPQRRKNFKPRLAYVSHRPLSKSKAAWERSTGRPCRR